MDDKFFPDDVFDAAALAYGNREAGDLVWPTTQTSLAVDHLDGMMSYPVAANHAAQTTAVVVQYHDDGILDAHYIYRQLDAVKYQYGCFLQTFLRDGVPTVASSGSGFGGLSLRPSTPWQVGFSPSCVGAHLSCATTLVAWPTAITDRRSRVAHVVARRRTAICVGNRHIRCTSAARCSAALPRSSSSSPAPRTSRSPKTPTRRRATSVTYTSHLTGCHGVASTSIPSNGHYDLTSFGGPGDEQTMSCGGKADGKGWYAASRQRYGCGAKVMVEANGKCVVLATLDYGPDVCVENAADAPILDVSPAASKILFNTSSAGWSDHLAVIVTEVGGVDAARRLRQPVAVDRASGSWRRRLRVRHGPGWRRTLRFGDARSRRRRRHVRPGRERFQTGTSATTARGTASRAARRARLAYGFCNSATLGNAVPPRTCVQSGVDRHLVPVQRHHVGQPGQHGDRERPARRACSRSAGEPSLARVAGKD